VWRTATGPSPWYKGGTAGSRTKKNELTSHFELDFAKGGHLAREGSTPILWLSYRSSVGKEKANNVEYLWRLAMTSKSELISSIVVSLGDTAQKFAVGGERGYLSQDHP
jgi:hypothetical protein